MEYTVENLCGLLIRSRLLPVEGVKAAYQRWLAEGKSGSASGSSFARWLVQKQLLTEYQASLLLRGKVDDFFLNQYQVLDRLGRGRMAGVYKALHASGQTVAIKVLPPSRARNAQILARFQREARLAMKLKHPNVVRSFQMGEARGLYYLVMEYLEGETLDEVVQRRKQMPPHEAVRLIHQALMGLQHIHDRNMVHRDLKPANLMLVPPPSRTDDSTMRSTVKILDIGLGREFFDESGDGRDPELTGEGVILGTPDYLAPEQARDPRTIDVRADIYSLGCVLYHLLTGQSPFPDKNLLNQMVRHATEAARPLKEFNAAIPDGLQQILNWMIAKQPAQRYPTPERAAQALQVFLLAETEPARRDDQPNMKKYLTWLEASEPPSEDDTLPPPEKMSEPAPAPAPPAPRPAPVPVAVAAKAVPVAAPKAAPVPRPAVATVAPAPASPTAPVPPAPAPLAAAPVARAVAAPAQPAAKPSAEEIDVELVPIKEPRPGLLQSLGLSRRDLILLGIGGAGMVLLVLLVLLVMMFMQG